MTPKDNSTSPSTTDVPAEQPHTYHHAGGNLPAHDHHDRETVDESLVTSYWRTNLRLLAGLLIVWFTVSFGFGILLVDELNNLPFFGFKMGFWWAQQGSILVFVVLIFVYAWLMKRLERRHGIDDDE